MSSINAVVTSATDLTPTQRIETPHYVIVSDFEASPSVHYIWDRDTKGFVSITTVERGVFPLRGTCSCEVASCHHLGLANEAEDARAETQWMAQIQDRISYAPRRTRRTKRS